MSADSQILVIGEALVDIVDHGGQTREHPGGSPANVALGLGRRGLNPVLLTRLGRDARASRIARHLERSGVAILAESFSDRPTSVARATLTDDGAALYDFDIFWELPDVELSVRPHVVHAGSLAIFLEPGRSGVVSQIERLNPRILTLDPNVRPELLGDPFTARPLFEQVAAEATVVKLSDEDAHWLYPGLSLSEVIARVAAGGTRLVVITLGADGAVLAAGGERVEVPAVNVPVVDTIGAGDTFMSSLIADYIDVHANELTTSILRKLGRRAASAAAITVSRAGADLPWADEVSRWI